MIEVQHLSKFYGSVAAIQDVSFEVKQGEILGFLGPNGAGKTTTMRILTCYMPATRGTARVAGYDVFRSPLEVRRRVGYLPENFPLYTDLTVRDFLDFVGHVKGLNRRVRRDQIAKTMSLCGVREVADRIIGHLSKGYRQRVGVAQALLNDPEVLILDEPTTGLDPKQIIETRELIRSLGGERTIILCTHILPEVSMTCSRVVIINKGRVVAQDTPENLTRQIQKGATIALEVDGPPEAVTHRLSEVPGVKAVRQDGKAGQGIYYVDSEQDQDVRRDLAQAVCASGWGLLGLRPVSLSLEEVFVQLVTEEETGDA